MQKRVHDRRSSSIPGSVFDLQFPTRPKSSSMGKHRTLKEVNTFIAVTENVTRENITCENILIVISNGL